MLQHVLREHEVERRGVERQLTEVGARPLHRGSDCREPPRRHPRPRRARPAPCSRRDTAGLGRHPRRAPPHPGEGIGARRHRTGRARRRTHRSSERRAPRCSSTVSELSRVDGPERPAGGSARRRRRRALVQHAHITGRHRGAPRRKQPPLQPERVLVLGGVLAHPRERRGRRYRMPRGSWSNPARERSCHRSTRRPRGPARRRRTSRSSAPRSSVPACPSRSSPTRWSTPSTWSSLAS